ncbi:NUDIX hydrolase [Shumkonia mesophila]|uniref:NUDIX hydrolase n=1 Tax=Shumkonia mesophila TaxID=2838854 RepID=UPI002934DE68|nr:NUDIX hydrolase [Shumkonia mesophila]
MTARPTPATIAAIVHEGRVLLVRRANPPDQGRWGYPGGRIEPGEGIAEAAVRELAEETGLVGEALDIFSAVDVIDRDPAGGLRYHYVLVAVLCRWKAGTPRAGDDALEVGWFSPDEIAAAGAAVSFDVERVARHAIRLAGERDAVCP